MNFIDRPDFKPDYSPYDIIKQGAFGSTYFRPIYSTIAKKTIRDDDLEYDWGGMPRSKLISAVYNEHSNKYKVKAGSSLKTWESKGWIKEPDFRGWFQWYCNYFAGRRIPGYDDWQIKRWKSIKARFGRLKNKTPKIKQVLLEWGIDANN